MTDSIYMRGVVSFDFEEKIMKVTFFYFVVLCPLPFSYEIIEKVLYKDEPCENDDSTRTVISHTFEINNILNTDKQILIINIQKIN